MSFIGAAIGAVGSIIGGKIAAKASGKAANIQVATATTAGNVQLQATREVIALQKEQFAQSRADIAPWRKAGVRALALQERAARPGGSLEDFQTSPGYEFVQNEMTRALGVRRAASGTFYSGRHMRELARYTAGIASQEFTNYYNRLASISGTGQTATSDTSRLGADAATRSSQATLIGAQNFGSTLLAAGAARASGVIGQGQIWRDVVGDLSKAATDIWS